MYCNRTGKKYSHHFDLWMTDRITELATKTGTTPSFPAPNVLQTWIATAETFGLFHSPPSLLKNTTLQFFQSLACHITGIYQSKCSLDCLQSQLTNIITFSCGSAAYIQSPQFIQLLNTPNSSSIFTTHRFAKIWDVE